MSSKAIRKEETAALRSLASLQPRFTTEHSIAAIEAVGPAAAADFLDSLRMRTLVGRRLAPFAEKNDQVRQCLQKLDDQLRRLRLMHEVLDENLDRLHNIALELGLEIFVGKGVCASRLYPDPTERDFNDIDVFVRTRGDATCLVDALRTKFGYLYQEFELPWLKCDPEGPMLYGQVPVVAPEGNPRLLNMDIHFGDYSVRHSSRLGLTAALPDSDSGLHRIEAEENLACIVNNAAGDYFVTAKDTNDILTAFSRDNFEVERFTARLREAHLEGFFRFMLETLRGSTTLTAEQETRLRQVPVKRTLEPAPEHSGADWNRRCLGTTVHTFTAHRADGIIRASRMALNAFSYYRRRLRLSVAPARPRMAREFALNRWTCIRLVPLDLAERLSGDGLQPRPLPPVRRTGQPVAGDTGVMRFDTESGTYLRIGDEFFVATVSYELSRDLIHQAAAASVSSR